MAPKDQGESPGIAVLRSCKVIGLCRPHLDGLWVFGSVARLAVLGSGSPRHTPPVASLSLSQSSMARGAQDVTGYASEFSKLQIKHVM